MTEFQQLYNSLIMLSQKIIQRQQGNPVIIIKQLLLDIDHNTFQSMFDRWGSKNLFDLKDAIQDYYNKVLKEKIRWQSNQFKQYKDDFIEIFIFIIDLALKADKSNYIQLILTMQESNQLILQPYIASITQRQIFFIPIQDKPLQTGQQVMELEQQNQKLKSEGQFWMQKYQDLKESYDYLKLSHDKLSEQVNLLKQDRYVLINQLGGSQYGSIQEIVEKVKRQVLEYEKVIQKCQKEIQQKKNGLKQRDEYIRTFQTNFKENKYEEKALQYQNILNKMAKLQKQMEQIKNKEEQVRNEWQMSKILVMQKDKEIEKLNNRVILLQAAEQKFNAIKKVHNQFKNKLNRNIKQ